MPPPTTTRSYVVVPSRVTLRSMDTHSRPLTARLEPLAPELKNHQCPEQMAVVVRPALVLAHQRAHIAGVEQALRGKTGRAQQLVHEPVPFVGQPLLHRHAEAFLAAREHGRRQRAGEGALQDPLAHSPAYLQTRGNGECEIDYLVVEVRYPRLERGRHAHGI